MLPPLRQLTSYAAALFILQTASAVNLRPLWATTGMDLLPEDLDQMKPQVKETRCCLTSLLNHFCWSEEDPSLKPAVTICILCIALFLIALGAALHFLWTHWNNRTVPRPIKTNAVVSVVSAPEGERVNFWKGPLCRSCTNITSDCKADTDREDRGQSPQSSQFNVFKQHNQQVNPIRKRQRPEIERLTPCTCANVYGKGEMSMGVLSPDNK